MAKSKQIQEELKKKFEEIEIEEEELGEIVEYKPIRFGNFYVYEVLFEGIGWRALVLPTPWDKAFDFDVGDIFYKGWFTQGRFADVWMVHKGWIYSVRAGTTIPLFWVIMCDWHIRQGASPIKVAEEGYGTDKDFAQVVIKLDYYQSQELYHRLLETQRKLVIYKEKYEKELQDIDKLADDRAADIVKDTLKMLQAVERQLTGEFNLIEWLRENWMLVLIFLGMLLLFYFMVM